MGDPKFPRKRYDTPFHPWKADRIQEEKGIEHKYGLKNKKEVWRAKSHLRGFRQQARGLLARSRTGDVQAQKEAILLLAKLNRQGLLSDKATLDDVLALGIDQLLSRRLQTQVYLKGFTISIDQARQFIAHGHITVGDTRVNVPGYYLKRGEEEAIVLTPGRPVTDDAHVARPKRVEGGGPVRLREYKPRTPERGFGGRGGPGGGRGPPRGGGGGFRGPGGGSGGSGGGFRGGPRGPPSGGPASGAPAPEAAAAAGAREEQVAKKKRADDAAKSQGGGAF